MFKKLIFIVVFLKYVVCMVNVAPSFDCCDLNTDRIPNVNISLHISFGDRSNNQIQSDRCGLNLPRDLMLKESNSYEGEFPWYVSLYKSTYKRIDYECAGSLISKNAVLTSAVCITVGEPVDHTKVIVFVGAYNFLRHNGHYQMKSVKSIAIHPEFDYARMENDLAMVRLNGDVRYTDYVRPICLWTGDPDINGLVGSDGIVPGWDYNESDYIAEELSFIKMYVEAKQKCVLKKTGLMEIKDSKTLFCTRFGSGVNVCKGDDGGGFFVKNNGIWFLRGVTTTSIGYQDEVICDAKHYSAVTDITLFIPWIQQNM